MIDDTRSPHASVINIPGLEEVIPSITPVVLTNASNADPSSENSARFRLKRLE
jgi:hypothetical protein